MYTANDDDDDDLALTKGMDEGVDKHWHGRLTDRTCRANAPMSHWCGRYASSHGNSPQCSERPEDRTLKKNTHDTGKQILSQCSVIDCTHMGILQCTVGSWYWGIQPLQPGLPRPLCHCPLGEWPHCFGTRQSLSASGHRTNRTHSHQLQPRFSLPQWLHGSRAAKDGTNTF